MTNKYNIKLVEATSDELTNSNEVLPANTLAECKDAGVFRWGDGVTAFKNLPNWTLSGSGGGDIPTGTDRQVLGYSSGSPTAVTIGWKQLSDLPSPPTFSNGVLIGTAFNSDGTALFAFVELALGEGGVNVVKPNAIPFYNPGQIGTGGGTLGVANAIQSTDAVNLGQVQALINAALNP